MEPSSAGVQKAALRCSIKERMALLDAQQRKTSDEAIFFAVLRALPPAPAAVFCFVSVANEVDTRRLMRHLWAGGYTLCVPRTKKGGTMEAVQIESMEGLLPAPFGLLEPSPAAPVFEAERLNLVVVPCLSCDEGGNRLGYGGGFYDRYLPRVTCPTVCLCRGMFFVPQLPREGHDIPVGSIATEQGLLPARRG